MTQQEWIIWGHKGRSSETMWAALNGISLTRPSKGRSVYFDIPHDIGDFALCLMYYRDTDMKKKDLDLVAKRLPWWKPITDRWDELTGLYDGYTTASHQYEEGNMEFALKAFYNVFNECRQQSNRLR